MDVSTICQERRFTPAYAGNTDLGAAVPAFVQVHPRIRGEYPAFFRIILACLGSPPHTRGILYLRSLEPLGDGFTPAYAGNTED